MDSGKRDLVLTALSAYSGAATIAIVGLFLLSSLGGRPPNIPTGPEFIGTVAPTTFTGILLIDHGESYLVQSNSQTLLIMEFSPGGADISHSIAQATSYLQNDRHLKSGVSVKVQGFLLQRNGVPYIHMLAAT